jgi:hypothetical protein
MLRIWLRTTLPPYIFLPLLTQQMTLRVAYLNYERIFGFLLIGPALPIDKEVESLRQY